MSKTLTFTLAQSARIADDLAPIIVNYNGWRDTVTCVNSLLASSVCPRRIVIVENHSPDDSWAQLGAHFHREAKAVRPPHADSGPGVPGRISTTDAAPGPAIELTLILAERNGGFGAGNNVGVRALMGEGFQGYLWLLNNDTEVFDDCVDQLVKLGERGELPDILGTTLVDLGARDRVQACGGHLSRFGLLSRHLHEGESLRELQAKARFSEANYPVGASILVHTSRLQGPDLFDERYFLYYEELALMWRFGIEQVLISTAAVVAHKGGASTGVLDSSKARSRLTDFHSIRSRILYGRQRGAASAVVAVAIGGAIAIKRLLSGDGGAALHALSGAWNGLTAPRCGKQHRSTGAS